MKKKLLAFVLASAMVFSMAGCGASKKADGGKKTAATTENKNNKALYINLASEPDHLDPALNSAVDGGCLAVNSFAGLYTYDKDGTLIPAVAESLPEVSDDGKTYTIKMKQTKWSNGEPVTANDFVYSWNRAVDKKTAADYGYLYDIVARDGDKLAVKAVDDYTLQVQLTNPCPYFNDLMAFPAFFPVYEKEVEAKDKGKEPGTWAQKAGFVSNGAYTLKEWKHNESMVYVKNPNYYDASNVKLEELHFMLSADNTATYAAYTSGDLDFIDEVPNDEIKSVMDNKEFHVVDQLGTYYIGFNVDSKLFKGLSDKQAREFREAISLLIDRQYIVDTVGQTGQQVADSFIPAGMNDGNGGTFKTDKTSYYDASKVDVDKAQKLLEDCGYKFTKKDDGTVTCDPAISIPYILNENDGHQKIAESIQSDLSALGIEMTIQTEDWNVFLDDRKKGNYTCAREGWLADYNDPINMLEMFTTKSGNNDCQFGRNPKNSATPANWDKYDELVNEIRNTTDFASRVDKMHKAEDMLMDTWAVIPIYYYNDIYMQKSNVDGIFSTVYGMKYFMYATKK
ncbi:MAG: peptide ABC transporter substrate-binding protein [Lachnospiraceae bacterium]|nr:peptide ABC transporter substrate-binding protein [Lachnospiraceae bacterium]